MIRMKKLAFLLTACLVLGCLLSGCGQGNGQNGASADGAEEDNTLTLEDFATATLGIQTGSSYDPLAKERFPNAERMYFSTFTDMILAAEQGKIDGFISDSPFYVAAVWEGANLTAVEEPIIQTPMAFVFQKEAEGSQLVEQMDEFILSSRENGLLDRLEEKWLGDEEPPEEEHPDYEHLDGRNGVITAGVAVDSKPLLYLKNGRFSGYEVELMVLFAQEYGYQLDIQSVPFEAILPGIHSGKYDIGAGGFTITEERKESVTFSEPYLMVDALMVTKGNRDGGQQAAGISGFFSGMKENFEKTFLRESRWKMILEGIGVTLFISVCSVAGGTLLGFALYLLGRAQNRAVSRVSRGIARVYSRIIAGTPAVVILMILYYVVFGSIKNMSGILVTIIGFSLIFGSFVYSHLTVCVSSVDKGQTEAAYALGYPRNKTFFRIILPQSMTLFLPSYCDQAVSLVLSTAVVGYIAVNDLTKVGDLIRSLTYEAFFPLISTAVIYFLLTWILALLLGQMKRLFDPKRRSREQILKGVKTK